MIDSVETKQLQINNDEKYSRQSILETTFNLFITNSRSSGRIVRWAIDIPDNVHILLNHYLVLDCKILKIFRVSLTTTQIVLAKV